jgi:uncharacterized Zn-binding protein involved in type VI secretion
MAAAQRNGDSNDGGGVINSIPQSTVFVNSKLVSVNGSIGTGHPVGPPHSAGTWKTANGSSTVSAGGIAINRTGDADTCTHTRAGGSDDVFVG